MSIPIKDVGMNKYEVLIAGAKVLFFSLLLFLHVLLFLCFCIFAFFALFV